MLISLHKHYGLPWVTYFGGVGGGGRGVGHHRGMGFKFHNSSAVEVASNKSPFYPPMEQIGGVKWSIRVRGCHLSLGFGSLGRFKDSSPGETHRAGIAR